MLTVEASVMSLVCWNLKVFLQGGLSPGKWRTNFADGLLGTLECNDISRLLKKHCLPEKSRPGILKCHAAPYSNVHLQLVYFKALITAYMMMFH